MRRSVRREPTISHLDLGDDFAVRRRAAADCHFRTLIRFLRRQVGQPWRQVQPELDARCRALRIDAAITKLLRERLSDHVDTDVVLRDGVGWVERKTGRRCSLFVHPVSGMLCLQNRQAKSRKPAEQNAAPDPAGT
jgi:hypothetical protein